MSETLGRIEAQIGLNPDQLIDLRREAADDAADIKEKLAPLWAFFSGGTSSPYDQKRKSLLSELIESERRRRAADHEPKPKEAELDAWAHSSGKYKDFLQESYESRTTMFQLEADLARAEARVAQLDRRLDLARAMMFWNTSEMRHL